LKVRCPKNDGRFATPTVDRKTVYDYFAGKADLADFNLSRRSNLFIVVVHIKRYALTLYNVAVF